MLVRLTSSQAITLATLPCWFPPRVTGTIIDTYPTSFLSTICSRRQDSSQMTISQGANVQPNVLNQLLGAGIGGLSLYGAAQKAFG